MHDSSVMMLTGCASGIGKAVAEALLQQGARLLLCDVNEDGLRAQFQESERVKLHVFDVRQEVGWQSAMELARATWGRVDVLMNIAGYVRPSYVHQWPVEEIRKHLEINTLGPLLGMRFASEHMVAQGSGHIINISSLAGIAPIPGLSLYSASKFALRGASLAAAQELREHGVKVSVICPDAVDTPMLDLQIDYEEANLTFSGNRVLTPDDLVKVILKKVLPKQPLEVAYPASRGFLARLAGFFPWVTLLIGDGLKKKGAKRRAHYQRNQGR